MKSSVQMNCHLKVTQRNEERRRKKKGKVEGTVMGFDQFHNFCFKSAMEEHSSHFLKICEKLGRKTPILASCPISKESRKLKPYFAKF